VVKNIGVDDATAEFSLTQSSLTVDTKAVSNSQTQQIRATLRAMCIVALSKFMVPYR
jgi:hypothetical protein